MRAWLLLPLLVLAALAPAWAADPNKPHPHQGVATKFSQPTPTALSAEEKAQLAAGAAVRKQVRYEGTSGGRGVAVFDVEAAPAQVWKTIESFERYPAWVDDLEVCKVYERAGEHIFAEFVIKGMGLEIRYYIDHTYRPTQGYMTWELDYRRESDLDDSTGYWLVYEAPDHPGHTRVEYTVDVRVSGWVPGFVEDMIAKKGLEQATEWVRAQTAK